MSERIDLAMRELEALGAVRPRRLADDTIELRPWPAAPDLSQKVNDVFERAGVLELRPWVWGLPTAERKWATSGIRVWPVATLALIGALVGASVAVLRLRLIANARSRVARRRQWQ